MASSAPMNGDIAAQGTATVATGSRPRSIPPRRRKLFSIGSLRFSLARDRLIDSIMDGVSYAVEGLVYLIGPMLILLALSIISLLTYSFATIILPMIQLKHADSSLQYLYIGLHCSWVLFLLFNTLLNYFLCVTTKHVGPNYDKVVRELAEATQMAYPETPAQLEKYRRDYEDRMVLRMRRQQQPRATEQMQEQAASSILEQTAGNSGANGVTQRKVATTATARPSNPIAPTPRVRMWMFMGPLEWGFCGNSNQPKPPRSHFDHVTKQLVLNLDHYCPWMFNSIGYFNYRYFVNFLFSTVVAMLYGAIICLEPFLLISSRAYREQMQHVIQQQKQGLGKPERLVPMLPYRDEKMLVTLSFMLCAAVGCAVLLLGGFHLYLTLTAQTTVEFHANFAHKRRAQRSGHKWQNPYSLGSAQANFEQVFGRRRPWFLALLPSWREPESLPVPIPGYEGRRSKGGGTIPTGGGGMNKEEESSENRIQRDCDSLV